MKIHTLIWKILGKTHIHTHDGTINLINKESRPAPYITHNIVKTEAVFTVGEEALVFCALIYLVGS
jgi:hypothetical protein